MVAIDVRQAELEREAQLDRLRGICKSMGIRILQVNTLPKYYIAHDKKRKIIYVDRSSSDLHISEFIECVFFA